MTEIIKVIAMLCTIHPSEGAKTYNIADVGSGQRVCQKELAKCLLKDKTMNLSNGEKLLKCVANR